MKKTFKRAALSEISNNTMSVMLCMAATFDKKTPI